MWIIFLNSDSGNSFFRIFHSEEKEFVKTVQKLLFSFERKKLYNLYIVIIPIRYDKNRILFELGVFIIKTMILVILFFNYIPMNAYV